MKLFAAVALALAAASPAFAGSNFVVDFERNWDYGDGVANYYNGGSTDLFNVSGGPNLGVSFVNVLGVSNDPAFPSYYANSPSPLGVAEAFTFAPTDRAFMNVSAGVDNTLTFFYSTPTAVTNAIQAYSGLNGTGTLLGSFNLAANSGDYSTWTQAVFSFTGSARSFELTNSANLVGFDNISAVPEPGSLALMLAGGVGLLLNRRARRPV